MSTTTITVPDGSFSAYLALPPGGSGPGIVLIQEIFGISSFITEKADQLAALGYVVVAPDVFWRTDPGFSAEHDDEGLQAAFAAMMRWNEQVPAETQVADLLAVVEHTRAMPEVGGGKVAVMGYCLGGRMSWEVAIAGSPDACVAYYGSGIGSRLDVADQVTCPVLMHYGTDDPYIPTAEAEAVRDALEPRGATVTIHDGAGHGFENHHGGENHSPADAARSFEATAAFLAEHLA